MKRDKNKSLLHIQLFIIEFFGILYGKVLELPLQVNVFIF